MFVTGGLFMELQNVSTLSIVLMAVAAFLSVVVPIGAIIYMGIRKALNWKALLFGAVLFIVFVLILENLMHGYVLGSDPSKSPIYQNTILYMLYGGFAAGIFEETARLLGFKFLIRVKDNESIDTGISYGLGHGGVEAMLLGGLSAIGNLMLAVTLNSGALSGITGSMTPEQLESFNTGVSMLSATPSYMFLISGVERMVALVLQISLSIFVLKAAAEKKWMYFLLAILLHAGIDMFAVLFQKGVISSVFVLEGVLMVATAIIAVIAFRVYKKTE